MNVLDLFSGIGGFSLGLERAGMRTVAFVEINPFCRQVLAERWPGVDCYHDIAQLDPAELTQRHGRIDLICGGFPCQDISVAGSAAGLAGRRSGLWRHFFRLIRDLRPRWVVIENVSALKRRGLGTVLADLASIGYDAEWHCIPASYVGAPHQRDRIWIVSHPARGGQPADRSAPGNAGHADLLGAELSDAGGGRLQGSTQSHAQQPERGGLRQDVPHAAGGGCEVRRSRGEQHRGGTPLQGSEEDLADTDSLDDDGERHGSGPLVGQFSEPSELSREGWWEFEPDVGRVAHGIPARVDRLEALGNAVVPDIPEMIGHAINRAEAEQQA